MHIYLGLSEPGSLLRIIESIGHWLPGDHAHTWHGTGNGQFTLVDFPGETLVYTRIPDGES